MSERREVRILADDGVGLAATLYLPDPLGGPQPCLLEALPYRKDDLTSGDESEYLRLRDEFGYAVCRLDLRGTGSSGGLATDEYPPTEQQDLAIVIAWLAGQEWCDGSVGMYGTSYSGFNALQTACERPPALKAICAIYATDDRYTDDVHYRGGALRFVDLVDYCHYMTPMNALPPVPAIWGARWREEWHRRIEEHEPWLFTWLEHPADGAYWRHGSVRPDYARIACPTMLVAGWADGYRNNTFRTVAALAAAGVPHRLVAGPWGHADPATAMPGPRLDLVPEMAAWWDRWLRGIDNGVDHGPAGPAVSCFVRASTRPEPDLDHHEGTWVREDWPSARTSTETLTLDERPAYRVRPTTGVAAWIDCAGHLPWGLSADQRHDDADSLRWEVEARGRQLMGHPVVRLRIAADRPVVMLAVKICDVFPDETSALVTRGSVVVENLRPGEVREVEVELDACAYSFTPGQRLRLSVAGADWPNTVTTPEPATLTVHGGLLDLPRWSGESPYDPPRWRPGASESAESAEGVTWQVVRDVLGRVTRCVVDHGSTSAIPGKGTATEHYAAEVGVDERTHDQRATAEVTFELTWPGISVRTSSSLAVTVASGRWRAEIRLEARESGSLVGERTWVRDGSL